MDAGQGDKVAMLQEKSPARMRGLEFVVVTVGLVDASPVNKISCGSALVATNRTHGGLVAIYQWRPATYSDGNPTMPDDRHRPPSQNRTHSRPTFPWHEPLQARAA